MASMTTVDVLNRLYAIHQRSLPIYLSYAKPWSLGDDDRALGVLAEIVADQKLTIDRFATLILDHNGDVEPGEFPMSFTGLHDLSVDYLVQQMIEHQQRDIAAIERSVGQLRMAPLAKALAEESLGAAKAHLDSLVELTEPAGDVQETAAR